MNIKKKKDGKKTKDIAWKHIQSQERCPDFWFGKMNEHGIIYWNIPTSANERIFLKKLGEVGICGEFVLDILSLNCTQDTQGTSELH